jgi:hypothetical protein
MPLMLLLPFFPLTTVMVGMFIITTVKCNKFECVDIAQDVVECDACWCYENGGFACCCCTACHNDDNEDADDHDDSNEAQLYDDSSDSFHACARK